MNNKRAKWIEDIFQSMKGSTKAKPSLELFVKIEDQIMASTVKVISVFQWKQYAAAAVIILIANTVTMIHYNKSNKPMSEDIAAIESNNQSLISSYQIYK